MRKLFYALLLLGACDLSITKNSGDCQSNTDCPNSSCVELSPDGFRVCEQLFFEATFCQDDIGGSDECCTSLDCAEGACFDSEQAQPFCGGIQVLPHNVCGIDDCAEDSDCGAGAICSLPNTFDSALRHCIPVSCNTDGDCNDEPDGSCAPIEDGCCGLTVTLACTYPSDGCRSDSDCGIDQICQIIDGRASCIVDQRLCPG